MYNFKRLLFSVLSLSLSLSLGIASIGSIRKRFCSRIIETVRFGRVWSGPVSGNLQMVLYGIPPVFLFFFFAVQRSLGFKNHAVESQSAIRFCIETAENREIAPTKNHRFICRPSSSVPRLYCYSLSACSFSIPYVSM